ncbi:MAG: hypothetical protein AB7O96_07400 [Pseudobdellovibrionaceae bacterium]
MRLLVVLFLLLNGSISTVFAADYEARREQALELLRDYPRQYRVITDGKLFFYDECRFSNVELRTTDAVSGELNRIKLEIYRPKHQNGTATVLIIPPTGGKNIIDGRMANVFCNAGLDSVIVKSWKRLDQIEEDMSKQEDALIRAAAAIRLTADYITETFRDSNGISNSIGIMGTSLGAMFASTVLAIDPRFKAAFLAVGGSPLSEVLATTKQRVARKVRETQMRANNLVSAEEYQEILKERLRIDLDVLVTPKKSLALKMLTAEGDGSVPTKTQIQLWESWGKPERFVEKSSLGHPAAIFNTYWKYREEIRKFFLESFNNTPKI